jgi:hypothetical protein
VQHVQQHVRRHDQHVQLLPALPPLRHPIPADMHLAAERLGGQAMARQVVGLLRGKGGGGGGGELGPRPQTEEPEGTEEQYLAGLVVQQAAGAG